MGACHMLRQSVLVSAALVASVTVPGSVHAHDGPHGESGEIMLPPPPAQRMEMRGIDPAAREAWLADCRQRLSRRDRGIGGAVIGGLVGGVAGNRIAGKGDRTVGTIAGAAVGSAAGMAIDKAEGRNRVRDECEAYLEEYEARYSQASVSYTHL
ncbi:MAG: glycine zipper 2TM domain-containing protein, partial [Novosphingobium sp.]|nr:glycine zipper 2TM domain-containing protein [Novosphingobium sp.]